MANRTSENDGRAADRRAVAFTNARMRASALTAYPGTPPETLAEAYTIQDDAIDLWSDKLVGWKVGRITGEWEKRLGEDRLSGPIFARQLMQVQPGLTRMPVFQDGFAAVEAECIIEVSTDAPADKTSWTIEEARRLVGSVRLGVEIASSPFAGINEAGPLVTISDFGNNHGLLIGEEIPDWENFQIAGWRAETLIEGEVVGASTPESIPGGPLESLRFLLENTARRGRPLRKGALISTGAITGVHEIQIGQRATVRSENLTDLEIALTVATPSD